MAEVMLVKSASLPKTHKNVHAQYEYYRQEITPRRKFRRCYAAFYDLPPGKSNYPYHYHRKNTEIFYILEGQGVLRTPKGLLTVHAGDVVVCPCGKSGAHKLTNMSDTVLRYLDVDTIHPHDLVHYPDSGKVGMVCHKNFCVYRKGRPADYYDGE